MAELLPTAYVSVVTAAFPGGLAAPPSRDFAALSAFLALARAPGGGGGIPAAAVARAGAALLAQPFARWRLGGVWADVLEQTARAALAGGGGAPETESAGAAAALALEETFAAGAAKSARLFVLRSTLAEARGERAEATSFLDQAATFAPAHAGMLRRRVALARRGASDAGAGARAAAVALREYLDVCPGDADAVRTPPYRLASDSRARHRAVACHGWQPMLSCLSAPARPHSKISHPFLPCAVGGAC